MVPAQSSQEGETAPTHWNYRYVILRGFSFASGQGRSSPLTRLLVRRLALHRLQSDSTIVQSDMERRSVH